MRTRAHAHAPTRARLDERACTASRIRAVVTESPQATNAILTPAMRRSLCVRGQGGCVRKRTTCTTWTRCRALPPIALETVMKNSRKPLSGLIALGAALAIPMAFAQDATTPPQDPATQGGDPAQSTAPASSQQPLTWADLDVDGNG